MGALVVDNLRVWIVTGAALAPVAKTPNFGPGSTSNVGGRAGECGEIGACRPAVIAGGRMLERRQRQVARVSGLATIVQARQHAGGERIAGADPVDDLGDQDRLRLARVAAAIDSRGQFVRVGINDLPGGRDNTNQARKSPSNETFTPGALAPVMQLVHALE